MTEGRIYVGGAKDAPFVQRTTGKEEAFPIPFGQPFMLEGKYEVHFRLYSTRGGGATWEYNLPDDPEMFLSLGRFNPSVRLIAENPIILWERHERNTPLPGSKGRYFVPKRYLPGYNKSKGEYFVEQRYQRGYNPFTSRIGIYFDSAEPFPADRLLHQFLEDRLEDEPWIQGHLRVYEVEIPDEMKKTWFEPYWGAKEFLNHQILGGEMLAKERKDGNLYALLRFPGQGWIVSPDHVKKPIRFYANRERFFVLVHPEPASDAVD